MYEYEVKIFSFDGIYETVYYLIITMSTTGYGRYYVAQSQFGQLSIIVAVPMGVGIQALFLLAWTKFSKFD